MSISVLFSVILSFSASDSIPALPFQHIEKKDGLSNSAITSIYMDRQDYIWFGSWDGLNRYDGSTIKIYKPQSFRKGTLSNNIVRGFLEDRNNLWVVTHKGLNRYDQDTDSFHSYLTDLNNLPFLENSLRASLGPDSTLWVSIIGQGLSKYDEKKDTFVPLSFQGIEKEWLQNVAGIGSTRELTYLLGSDGLLVCLVDNKKVYSKQLTEKGALRLHFFFELHNQYYLALATDRGNLLLYKLDDLEQSRQEIHLSDFSVSSLSTDKNHTALWAGTELGDIYKLTIVNGKFDVTNMGNRFPQLSRSKRKILSITETRQDIFWVGTDGDGVYKFLTRPKPFFSISSGATDKATISNSIVRSVYEDVDGTLYAGTRGGGLSIISPGSNATRVLSSATGLSNNTVLSLNKDSHSNLWIGVDGEGIDMLEAGTGKIFHFPRDFDNHPNISFQFVYAICVDAYGSLWLGTSGSGVIHLKVSKTKNGRYHLDDFRQITHAKSPPSINSNIVYSIVEETPNILWFGTRGAGAYRYNSLSNKIEEHIFTGSGAASRLSDDDVLSLFMGANDELWIGTSGGLNRLSLREQPHRNTYYGQQEGLSNNTIHGILEDKKGFMWLSTNNGLIMFDRRKGTFKTFDTSDGLQNNEYTDGATFLSRKTDKLFFGGIDGLDIIYPNKLDSLNYFPRLTITEFQVHNMAITPSDSNKILQKHINLAKEISLDYDQNFISFHFTTLNYWNKQRTEYAYFLENFDKDWNYIGRQSSINLTNIPPGNYRLHINYTNENGTWNPYPRIVSIVVHPPFWKTGWAYALYILLLVGLQIGIVLIVRQRARTKRAAAIDKFKMQQLKALNDYKLQFFTNVAHEFLTPLTLILGPVTALMKKTSGLWENNQLKTIYSNSLRLQKLIDELLQFRKIESGKEKPFVNEIELVALTHDVVASFQQHAHDHEVNLEFIPEPETVTGWVDVKKLEKILINLISNAIKYNVKGGSVIVRLREQMGRVKFIVKDTGVGIAEGDRDRIFETFYQSHSGTLQEHEFAKSAGIGLSLTRSLVQLHQGDIEVESTLGAGSVFTVTIPITREAYTHDSLERALTIPITNLEEKVQQEFRYVPAALTMEPAVTVTPSYSLLVVDDHDQILLLLQNILSDQYKIFTALNGQDALHTLEEERIDLVISDVRMPGMDGLTLCRRIKDNIQTSHIPVILLTAKAEIEDRIEGLQVGADSYIPKPFHPDHLFIRIEKLIKNREQIKKRFENFADVELEKISTGIGEKDDEFFIRITKCIQAHLSEPEFTADIMAEEVGMSKASLYKKVKATVGLTPHGLIKQYRLRKAADLLKNSTMSVSEVIYEIGFNSRSYFYKSFNEMFHCHPKDFGGAKTG